MTVSIARSVTADALFYLGVTSSCIEDIRLALGEACNNVIQHAATSDEYEVRFEVDGDVCTLSVRDAGIGADSSAFSGTLPDADSAHGRGVAIIRALTDRAEFTSGREIGTIVELVKRLEFVGPET
jgi:serine/threonine-protein kinase RsbW